MFFQGSVQEVDVPCLAPPLFTPVPIPVPTPISTPMPLPGGHTVMQEMEYRDRCENIVRENEHAAEEVEMANQIAMNSYYCDLLAWQAEYQETMNGWQEDRLEAMDPFLRRVHESFDDVVREIEETGEGFFHDSTRIQAAIYVASEVFQNAIEDGRFEEYKLLILSDMDEQPPSYLTELPIALDQVDVIVAMMYCGQAFQCEQQEEKWIREFGSANARSVRFLLVIESTPETLCDFLRR